MIRDVIYTHLLFFLHKIIIIYDYNLNINTFEYNFRF